MYGGKLLNAGLLQEYRLVCGVIGGDEATCGNSVWRASCVFFCLIKSFQASKQEQQLSSRKQEEACSAGEFFFIKATSFSIIENFFGFGYLRFVLPRIELPFRLVLPW